MALQFKGVNGLAPASSVTSQNPPKVSIQGAGDFVVTELFLNASRTVSISAGWTILHQATNGSTTYAIGCKVVSTSSETPTWSWSGSCNTLGSNNWLFQGQWTGGNPVGSKAFLDPASAGTTLAVGPIMATAPNSLVFSWNSVNNSNQTIPIPSGYKSDNNFTSAAQSERAAEPNSAPSAGSTTSTSVTITSATSQGSLIEILSQAPTKFPSTIDQTLPGALSQEVDVTVSSGAQADIAQTFANISQVASATVEEPVQIAQTFFNISQSLTGSETNAVFGDIDQTLPGAIQELIVATEIEITSVSSTFFPMEQALTGSVGGAIHIAQTLPGMLQEAIVAMEIEITSLNQTLPGSIQQLLDVDQTPPVVIRMTLQPMTQTFTATVEDQTTIDMTFITMEDFPRFAEIDMTLGGSGGESGGGGTYRTWWRASCGP